MEAHLTIIVPYKDDILSGTELLYCLRSIEKYLIGWTNLIIIGTPPEWYVGEKVYAKDYDGRKQYSIYQKLLIACELNNVTDDFIEWDDDVFLNKEFNVNDFRYWSNGLLKDQLKKNHGIRYKESISNTIGILGDNAIHYDLHNPIVYNKGGFKSIFWSWRDEAIIKTSYVNSNHSKFHTEIREDCKINELKSKDFLKEHIKDRLFFSTSTNGMKRPMIELLNELYPTKSRFEK